MTTAAHRGIRSAQVGIAVNAVLAAVKLVAGILGNTYALVADAVESSADVFSSLVVWGGLRVAAREPDEKYPFGYGKAEALAAMTVATMLLGAALGITIQAVREIRTPHHSPAPWTLVVLVVTVLVKVTLSRHVHSVGSDIGSTAVRADAWHHMSDALTSAAAFVGISVALLGGPGWEAADDWAALAASVAIAYNGASMLRLAMHDLMDRAVEADTVAAIRAAAEGVTGVLAIEKLAVRKAGLTHEVAIHVHAAPRMPLDEAHALGGLVKATILRDVPTVRSVLVHMEPFPGRTAPSMHATNRRA
jgi:cation diffusion facilitator family transporter